VKEKQNSSSHDPVTVTGGVKRGTGTSTNSDVNVDQNALNSGMNTLGKTFGNSNAERANTVGKESESLNSSPTDGMDSMLENGLWLIRNVQLILKKWTPGANIINEDVCNIPVWVKFHDIPKTIFTDDGLFEALAKPKFRWMRIKLWSNELCSTTRAETRGGKYLYTRGKSNRLNSTPPAGNKDSKLEKQNGGWGSRLNKVDSDSEK
ncbi:alpha/beta hydrolases superfamily protein, partial [Tanacetum coccineum]